MMVEWITQMSSSPSGQDMSSATWLGQFLEANTSARTSRNTSQSILSEMLNLNEGPVSPEVAVLYWGPDDQGDSRRSLPCKHVLVGPMLAFCGHSGLGPAHTKPKQAQCGLAQVRPTALGSPQAL